MELNQAINVTEQAVMLAVKNVGSVEDMELILSAWKTVKETNDADSDTATDDI